MFHQLNLLAILILGISACVPVFPDYYDDDGDGVLRPDDCDDTDPANFPGNDEACDGQDNDCDTEVDEDPALDVDGDGVLPCAPTPDCDDLDPSNFPGNDELCDAQDNDCDEELDEGFDSDGDGVTTCGLDGVVGSADDDCADDDPDNFPGNAEVCDNADNDCSGDASDEETDDDGDGYDECDAAGQGEVDCDDDDPDNFPGNAERCDDADNDCDDALGGDEIDDDGDGVTECDDDCDDDDPDNFPGNAEQCDDADNDCDGALGAEELDDDGDGQTECDGDCDDDDPDNFTGNAEVCDEADNDCDNTLGPDETDDDGDGVDECDAVPDCDDDDADNYPGNAEVCDDADNDCDNALSSDELDDDGDGQTECDGDCDDADDANFPGNLEVCDAADNDCDNALSSDELDDDGDGQSECDGDCDDTDDANFTGNPEVCDGQDNDCTGAPAPADVDSDGDGVRTCEGDCDDAESSSFPGNPEICDGIDNDCISGADYNLAVDHWVLTDSTDDAGPPFAPVALVAPTIITLADDELSSPVPVGFDFDFNGTLYDEVMVRSNGFAQFAGGSHAGWFEPLELGVADSLDEFIAFWWGDLNPSTGGTISYKTVGVSPNRVFVVEFDQVPYFNDDDESLPTTERVTLQLHLHETTHVIEVHYTQADRQPPILDSYLPGPTVGVEGSPPTAVVYFDQDQDATLANFALRFAPSSELDDDGDGWSPCDGDCDDIAADNFPGNPEICDGLDNDCNAAVDFGADVVQHAGGEIWFGGGDTIAANVYQVVDTTMLTLVEGHFVDADSDAIVTMVVYSREDPADPWLYETSAPFDSLPSADFDWVGTDELAITLEAGRQYAVGWHQDNPIQARWQNATGTDPDWGSFEGQLEQTGLSVGDEPGPIDAPVEPWALRLTTLREYDGDGDGAPVCADDCDEADPTSYPGADELCDGVDNDCDGTDPTDETDDDGDGLAECEGDCDDTDSDVNPAGTEVCDGVDNDCEGSIDLGPDELFEAPAGPNVNTSFFAGSGAALGNVYLLTEDTHVSSIEVYAADPFGTSVATAVVATRPTPSDPWEMVAIADLPLGSSLDWWPSDELGADLVAGEEYFLGWHWTLDVHYTLGAAPSEPSWATFLELQGDCSHSPLSFPWTPCADSASSAEASALRVWFPGDTLGCP